ncbi:hypothetical protein [Anaerorhabdus sp.]|jgi:hypothetical protein|uniref:hypothetical protein n=1 Tax=Anaerorhabdus sp. TaxID=1872524 RepID=UPI002FC5F422
MKKVFKWVGIVVAILVVGFFALNLFAPKPANVEDQEMANAMQGMYMGDSTQSDLVETEKGIVYNGKVVPVDTFYYSKDPTLTFNDVYVKEGDIIEKETILFDYKIDDSIDSQIQVLEKDFLNMKQDLDDYYTRVENLKQEIAQADKSDKVYVNYLEVELNNASKHIDEVKVNWINAEAKIEKLKEMKTDGKIKSDIGGLVYKVNESTSIDPSSKTGSAYIVLYSTAKKVRISVSEYEYQLVSPGQDVEVTIESTKKTYTCKVLSVDLMPNNLETEDTSYYNVEIEIPEEVPYGYSAIVTVPKQ